MRRVKSSSQGGVRKGRLLRHLLPLEVGAALARSCNGTQSRYFALTDRLLTGVLIRDVLRPSLLLRCFSRVCSAANSGSRIRRKFRLLCSRL